MIKLGAQTFIVPVPGGMTSFALQQRILPVAGRVARVFLALLDKADGTPGDLLNKDIAKLLPAAMPAVGEIFSQMPADELEAITRTLLRDATADKLPLFTGNGAGDPFDAIMRGRTIDTWKLLWHALQVWYPDFFILAAGLSGGAVKASPSETSSTSPTVGPATG